MHGMGGTLIFGMMGLCLLFVPLGMWKLIELIIWVVSHIRWVSP